MKSRESNIRAALERSREVIREKKRLSEDRTKRQIIEPILKSLDWDPNDDSQVDTEAKTKTGRVDYKLKYKNEALFVEAKPLGAKIKEENVEQLRRYLFDGRTKHGVITNGKDWAILTWDEGIVWQVDIRKDTEKVLEKMKMFVRKDLEKLEEKVEEEVLQKKLAEAWEKIKESRKDLIDSLEDLMKDRLALSKKHRKRIKREIRPFLEQKIDELLGVEMPNPEKRAEKAHGTKLPAGKKSRKPISSSPVSIRIGRTSRKVSSYRDVLAETANILIAKRKITRSEIPLTIKEGSKRYLINTRPVHGSGKKFVSKRKLEKGLWTDVNYSAELIKGFCNRLLDCAGLSESDLEIFHAGEVLPGPEKKKRPAKRVSGWTGIEIGPYSREIRSSKEILMKTFEIIEEMGLYERLKIPMLRTEKSKRYIINFRPYHSDGKPFMSPERLRTGAYIETHGSTNYLEQDSRAVLEACGVSGKKLKIK